MKNHTKNFLYTIDEIESAAQTVSTLMNTKKIITFTGLIGSGKTTLIQKLLTLHGVSAPIQSPTFTYLSIYKNNIGAYFYHFDLYRLKSSQMFIDAGFQEYLYSPSSHIFIEWPEIIQPLLYQLPTVHITINYVDQNTRSMEYTYY